MLLSSLVIGRFDPFSAYDLARPIEPVQPVTWQRKPPNGPLLARPFGAVIHLGYKGLPQSLQLRNRNRRVT
jgi:hypothetical protein